MFHHPGPNHLPSSREQTGKNSWEGNVSHLLQMHQVCFLIGTLWFSVLQWNWTHTLLRMGRVQGEKVSISQCWWFCYKASSSENTWEPQLQVVFLWNGPFGHQDIQSHLTFHTFIWFLCITGFWFPFLWQPVQLILFLYHMTSECVELAALQFLAIHC